LPQFIDGRYQLSISSTIMGRTLKESVIIFDTAHFQPVRLSFLPGWKIEHQGDSVRLTVDGNRIMDQFVKKSICSIACSSEEQKGEQPE
jgi:hypothetical protein